MPQTITPTGASAIEPHGNPRELLGIGVFVGDGSAVSVARGVDVGEVVGVVDGFGVSVTVAVGDA